MKTKVFFSAIFGAAFLFFTESFSQEYTGTRRDTNAFNAENSLLQTGNVGVGTLIPPAKLSILGSYGNPAIPGYSSTGILRIGSAANEGIDIGKMDFPIYTAWIQAGYDGVEADPLSLQPLGGNVGIGNSNPLAKLHVSGGDALINDITIGRGGGSSAGNTSLGENALHSNTTGYYNTASGYNALYSNKTGNYNSAFGAQALYYDSTGNYNTASGYQSLRSNGSGHGNTAMGYRAMRSITTGSHNTALGQYSMNSVTTGRNNVAIGTHALYGNTTLSFLVAIGDSALYHSSGAGNTAIGSKVLFNNTSGYHNTSIGYNSMYTNTGGNYNTAIGYKSLYSNLDGIGNIAIGYESLHDNTSGDDNIAMGSMALNLNTEGEGNIAIGYSALTLNLNGNNNTAIGEYALASKIVGDNNTAVGNMAGTTNSTANNCTFLGCDAFIGSSHTNTTGIGYDAHPNASNQVQIGNSSVTEIGGYAGWTTFTSDGKYNRNVKENVAGLDFILRLRPVTYNLDVHQLASDLGEDLEINEEGGTKAGIPSELDLKSRNEKAAVVYTGFIAQEVENAMNSIGFDFSGVDVPANPDEIYGLRYAEFVVPLIKAVQEQQAIIEKQQKQNESQQKQIDELIMTVRELKGE
jgi:hypothetical protein